MARRRDSDSMPDRGVGVSAADLKRGYIPSTAGLDVPPAEQDAMVDGVDYRRAIYDERLKRFRDRYSGGFLARDGFSSER